MSAVVLAVVVRISAAAAAAGASRRARGACDGVATPMMAGSARKYAAAEALVMFQIL